jgi:hypothetical protein
MFEDLKYLLKEAKLPEMVKVPLTVLIKAVAWVPWLFVGIGLLLNREYFFYWLAFFLFLEGVLITALIYVLVMVIRSALPTVSMGDQAAASGVSSLLNDAVVKGIIGNAAFYLFILAMFVLLKAMGVTDRLWQALLARIGG